MEKVSVVPAFGAGFGLIGRQPVAVLVWGLVYMALTLGPAVLYFVFAAPGLLAYYRDLFTTMGSGGTPALPPPGVEAAMNLFQGVQLLTGLAAASIVYAAIYRAVLRPAERGFSYLRLGMDEVRLGVVIVVLYILFVIAIVVGVIVLMIPMAIGLAVSGAAGGGGEAIGAFTALLVFVGLGLAVYPVVRFGMALPMTIAERRICIFEGWKFTKGYGWPLTGLAYLQILMIIGLYVAAIAIFLGMGVSLAGDLDGANFEKLFEGPDPLRRFMPMIATFGVIYAVLMFVALPVMSAPWASAYQRIAATQDQDKSSVFD